ncbi:hypothetical protein [Microtetraspora sp. NBRC 16547]|nr:hypothetical protein [Microtetraspora sp. NBRC 16547]
MRMIDLVDGGRRGRPYGGVRGLQFDHELETALDVGGRERLVRR